MILIQLILTNSENQLSWIEQFRLVSDIILTLIAITGVVFSIINLKKAEASNKITLKEIRKSDKRYRLENMPLLKFEIQNTLLVEGLKFMSGDDVDFNTLSFIKNVGLGPAKNIKLRIEGIYENKGNRFMDNGNKVGFDIDGAYSLPIFKYDEDETLIKGISLKFCGDKIDDLFISIINKEESYKLPDDHLSGLLVKSAIDFFYANELRGYNSLYYIINIEYESLFGEKIVTKQMLERVYHYSVLNVGEVIDGVCYGDTNINIFFEDIYINFHSELLE